MYGQQTDVRKKTAHITQHLCTKIPFIGLEAPGTISKKQEQKNGAQVWKYPKNGRSVARYDRILFPDEALVLAARYYHRNG